MDDPKVQLAANCDAFTLISLKDSEKAANAAQSGAHERFPFVDTKSEWVSTLRRTRLVFERTKRSPTPVYWFG
jgi:hypothetical protein